MSFYSDFAGYYEAVFPFEEGVYSFLRARAPAGARRVLDVGCGTGDYCAAFARDGLDAIGVDLDPEMIEVARERHPGPSFRVMDARDVAKLDGTFGLAFSIGNVVSHLRQDAVPGFLASVRGLLAPSGVWILQVVNWDFILSRRTYRFPDIVVGDVVFTREYPEVSRERLRFITRLSRGEATIFEGGVWLYPLTASACIDLTEAAGFDLLGHYGDFRARPFDPNIESSSVYVLGRRD